MVFDTSQITHLFLIDLKARKQQKMFFLVNRSILVLFDTSQITHLFLIHLKARKQQKMFFLVNRSILCLLYTSPSPRDGLLSRMPSSA